MRFEPAMQRYNSSLAQAANEALLDGLGPMDLVHGLAGTLAASVRSAGGTNTDVSRAFRTLADGFETRNAA